MIALQRTGNPGGLSCLRPHLDAMAALIQMLRFEPSMFFVLSGAGDCAAADRQPWRAELPASPPGRHASLNPNVEIRTLHVFCFVPGAGDCAAADRRPRRAELPASPPGRAGSLNPNVEIRTLHVFVLCQELVIALQRTGDPGGLSCLRPHLDALAGLDPTAEAETPPDWPLLLQALKVF